MSANKELFGRERIFCILILYSAAPGAGFRFRAVEVEGYEADDVIATLTCWAASPSRCSESLLN